MLSTFKGVRVEVGARAAGAIAVGAEVHLRVQRAKREEEVAGEVRGATQLAPAALGAHRGVGALNGRLAPLGLSAPRRPIRLPDW